MSAWILILVIYSSAGQTVAMQEFLTQKACQKAADVMGAIQDPYKVRAVCVSAG